MEIRVRGGSPLQKALTREIIAFAKKELLPNFRTLSFIVRIRKFRESEGNVVGWCIYEDCNIRPREFSIDLAENQSVEDFCKTLFHELVHVKQYALGEMRERHLLTGHSISWKGTDHTKTSYRQSPWEKEAYKMQNQLYKKFMKEVV